MKLLIKADCSNEHVSNCTVATVELDVELALAVVQRRELFQTVRAQDSGIHELVFWCEAPRWYDLNELLAGDDDELALLLDSIDVLSPDGVGEGAVRIEKTPPNWVEERTEMDMLVISDHAFSFRCSPKHIDGVTSSTVELSYDLAREVLKP